MDRQGAMIARGLRGAQRTLFSRAGLCMDLRDKIRLIEDFPVKGVHFRDITTLLQSGEAFHHAVDELAEYGRERCAEFVVGPEARGFVFGAPVAYALGVGFAPIRKQGKLPGDKVGRRYDLEYGQDGLEMHRDAVHPGQRVLIVDDLLATGGTIESCVTLVEDLGAEVAGLCFLIELDGLHGRDRLRRYDVRSLIQYE